MKNDELILEKKAVIKELIRSHRTPLSQKLISANPKLIQENMKIGQIWGQGLSIKFNQRMPKILEKEN